MLALHRWPEFQKQLNKLTIIVDAILHPELQKHLNKLTVGVQAMLLPCQITILQRLLTDGQQGLKLILNGKYVVMSFQEFLCVTSLTKLYITVPKRTTHPTHISSVCVHCNTPRWPTESASIFCSIGMVRLPHLKVGADSLVSLLCDQPGSKHFLRNARSYNFTFEITNFGHKPIRDGN